MVQEIPITFFYIILSTFHIKHPSDSQLNWEAGCEGVVSSRGETDRKMRENHTKQHPQDLQDAYIDQMNQSRRTSEMWKDGFVSGWINTQNSWVMTPGLQVKVGSGNRYTDRRRGRWCNEEWNKFAFTQSNTRLPFPLESSRLGSRSNLQNLQSTLHPLHRTSVFMLRLLVKNCCKLSSGKREREWEGLQGRICSIDFSLDHWLQIRDSSCWIYPDDKTDLYSDPTWTLTDLYTDPNI